MNMKTDDEMYQSLIIRYDAYQAKKKRTLAIERTAAVLLGAAAVFAVGVTTRAMKPPEKPTVPDSSIISDASSTSAKVTTSAQPAGTSKAPANTEAVTSSANVTSKAETTSETVIASDTETEPATEPQQTETPAVETTVTTAEPPPATVPPDDPGVPNAVLTNLNVSYDEARARFAHPIVQGSGSDFLGYRAGIMSRNGNIDSSGAVCISVEYDFTDGIISVRDQDRSAGKSAGTGIEQYEYRGRTFVEMWDSDDEQIQLGYFPTDTDGLAYVAVFDRSVGINEIMDRIISVEL